MDTQQIIDALAVIKEAVGSHDPCPDWKTCSLTKIQWAERRAINAARAVDHLYDYLDIPRNA